MAETNLESHGSWQKLGGNRVQSWNVPGSFDAVARGCSGPCAGRILKCLKTITSVLFWSLGNESYAGDDRLKADAAVTIKETDPGSLVHYEGVVHNRAYEDCDFRYGEPDVCAAAADREAIWKISRRSRLFSANICTIWAILWVE